MEIQARIDAAKARLDSNIAVLVHARKAGAPCRTCCWHLPSAHCGHPAYGKQSFDAATGEMALITRVTVAEARGADGLCGFEATLFEDRTRLVERIRDNQHIIKRCAAISFIWFITADILGFIMWGLLIPR